MGQKVKQKKYLFGSRSQKEETNAISFVLVIAAIVTYTGILILRSL